MDSNNEQLKTIAIGWLDRSIPQQPLVKVEGYGTVGLPVNEQTATELAQYMEQASYGKGEARVLDRTVRDTLQMGPDKFTIGNYEFSQAVATKLVDAVKQELGLKDEVWAELNNLLLYKPGGHFKPHRVSEKTPDMFGTLIVQLPSEFTGGDLVVRHAGQEVVVKMSQEGSSSYCVVAAHYSDCEHKVQTVESGYRLALIYSLCWRGTGRASSAGGMVVKGKCTSKEAGPSDKMNQVITMVSDL